jgi:hypothetical protein
MEVIVQIVGFWIVAPCCLVGGYQLFQRNMLLPFSEFKYVE